MEQQEWSSAWTAAIGEQVRVWRERRGVRSVQKLADRCAELGYPIPRATLDAFERGNRPSIPVHELAVIAAALDVPPTLLLFPLQDDAVDLLPGVQAAPTVAIQWFAGESTRPGADSGLGSDAVETLELLRRLRALEEASTAGRPNLPALLDVRADLRDRGVALPDSTNADVAAIEAMPPDAQVRALSDLLATEAKAAADTRDLVDVVGELKELIASLHTTEGNAG